MLNGHLLNDDADRFEQKNMIKDDQVGPEWLLFTEVEILMVNTVSTNLQRTSFHKTLPLLISLKAGLFKCSLQLIVNKANQL